MPRDPFEEPIPNISSEDEEDENISGYEVYSAQEIDKLFQTKYKICDESTTSMKSDYILNLCCDQSFCRIACGLSRNAVHIFDVSRQKGLLPVNALEISEPKTTTVCGVKFLDETPHSLLAGTVDGKVRLFDLRTSKEEVCFKAITNEAPKTVTCFDRNANSRILCMGSDLELMHVYLFFFDIRKTTSMGAYYESHSEDITSVRFHPTNPDILSSGCTAGLINVFDISQDNEDDALLTTINTESSVFKLNWHKNVYEKDIISCITDDNCLKTFQSEEGDSVVDFERSKITEVIRTKSISDLNLVNCHNMQDGNALLLAGNISKKGEILRSALVKNKNITPHGNFEGNKQIVRESILDLKSDCIVTVGESAIVSLWSPQVADESAPSLESDASKLKAKTNTKIGRTHGKAPY